MTVFQSRDPAIALSEQSLTQTVLSALASRGDEVVLTDGPTGRTMTADALTSDIKRLAAGLAGAGFGPGQVLALMAPNMPEFAVVLHAALWAGGAVTTINPAYTPSEVQHQLNDAGATRLFIIAALAADVDAMIAGTGVHTVVVIDGPGDTGTMAGLMGAGSLDAQVPVDLDHDVALMPYSSGTTGLPKGVMLSHRSLGTNLDQLQSTGATTPGEVTVCFLPFFHIYGLQVGLNGMLACGGACVTLPRFDLEAFLRLNQQVRARTLWLVPPVALALAKHPLVDQFDLSSVEVAVSAAAPFGADLAEQLAARLNCKTIQAYGMTETSPLVTTVRRDAPRKGSVGTLVSLTSARIVDPDSGDDLGVDADGELWIKGPQVMSGYLNNPAATAESIAKDGWLRTGDIAHFDEDGHLYITDRLKELIKYKGFQVAPAELEAVLLTHPDIADAAIAARPDPQAGEIPVAFVVPAAGKTLTDADVTGYLDGRLAHYKQVHRVIFTQAIPRSASGKILRRHLKE